MTADKFLIYERAEGYLVSKKYFSDKEISDNVFGSKQHGIKAIDGVPAFVLMSGSQKSEIKSKYPDGWEGDVFYYRGMGETSPTGRKRNRDLNETLTKGGRIYVLRKEDADDKYEFIGRFVLKSESIETPDGIIFPLVLEENPDEIKNRLETGAIGGGFFGYLERKGIFFPTEVVEGFLISIKTKPFLILSGSTGNGKTALAKAYGEFVRERFKGDYALVAVGSNWTESRFVLGYVNPILNEFVSTPSYEIMEKACKDPVHPYVLILDEMNLSRVEYYFSDLLSMMESGESIDVDKGNGKSEKLRFADNLVVIGTVNMDETTNTLSPKVLDRANVISFPNADVNGYLSTGASIRSPPRLGIAHLERPSENLDIRNMNAKEIIELLPKGTTEPLSRILGSLQNALGEMGFPMGYRALDEIMRFLYISWLYEGQSDDWNWKRYLDSQIMQKVLPRIHGDSGIASGLTRLQEVCKDIGDVSADRVQAMVETLRRNRHVSFNL